jgi:HEAT repeat protein
VTRSDSADRWRQVVEAGHAGDAPAARTALAHADPVTRELALGALARCDALADDDLAAALADPDPGVRRRAVELAAMRPHLDLLRSLDDPDPVVLEHAAWACGEHVDVDDAVLARLIDLATASDIALVREAAVAALGAIGDDRGVPAILAGCADQPAVRRRAVLALAPFEGPEVDDAIERALSDRDWQVRQAAEDLVRAARG